MSDESLTEEFEKKKQSVLAMFPNKKDEINACSTFKELYEVFKQSQSDIDSNGENEDQNGTENDDKQQGRKITVEHIHKYPEEPKQKKESPSIYTEGADLSKTGGKLRLPNQKGKAVSFDPTEQGESGRQVIRALYDEIDLLEFKQSRGGLNADETKRYNQLKAKRDLLWLNVGKGMKARGEGTFKGSFWVCPQCKSDVVNSNRCDVCGYILDTPINEETRLKWKNVRGK